MGTQAINSFLYKRLPYDPDGAKKLLADAGYPNGFEVGFDCPNDRYVNDGPICQAIVGMLARVGIKLNALIQPKAQYFAKILKPNGFKTSFYLLGWTPNTLDSHNVLYDIIGCRDDEKSARGETNLGGYCNKQLDGLTDQILGETDATKRFVQFVGVVTVKFCKNLALGLARQIWAGPGGGYKEPRKTGWCTHYNFALRFNFQSIFRCYAPVQMC